MNDSRFDNIKFDRGSVQRAENVKSLFIEIAGYIESRFEGQSASIALTKLEEAAMWTNKAIRDDQISREKRDNDGL